MGLHHYLPATYIGEFSEQKLGSRRKREIFVGNRNGLKIIKSSGENFCAEHNFYSIEKGDNPNLIDDIWSLYEKDLQSAIEKLIDRSLDAESWARTLVPFVTCLFLRGPEYNIRFQARIRNLASDKFNSKNNTNLSRQLEIQRLIGLFTVAEWRVCKIKGDSELITNDIGYCLFGDIQKNIGISIPLNRWYILQIVPRNGKNVAEYVNGKWMPLIIYHELQTNNHLGFNKSINDFAQNFIFGSNEEIIKTNLNNNTRLKLPNPVDIGFLDGGKARIHEFTWHRLISAISKNPNEEYKDFFELDSEILAKGWCPPLVFPSIGLSFPPSFKINNEILSINLL